MNEANETAENARSEFATVEDIQSLWRPMTSEEQERAAALLPLVSDVLRQEAIKAGKDLDKLIDAGMVLASVAKAVTVDIVVRILRQETEGEAMSQESQSALGYTWSGTYAVPGGGIANAVLRNDLKRLGLRRQQYGVIEFYANQGNHG